MHSEVFTSRGLQPILLMHVTTPSKRLALGKVAHPWWMKKL